MEWNCKKMKSNKALQIILAMIMILGFIVPVRTAFAQSDVVQTVNDIPFTVDQYVESAKFYRFNLIQQYNYYVTIYRMYGMAIDDEFNQQFADILGENGAEKIREIVLANAAHQVIVAAEAEKAGLSVSDEEVETRLKDIFGYGADADVEQPDPAAAAEDGETSLDTLDTLGSEGISTEPEINKELEFRNKVDEYFSAFVKGAFTVDFFKGDLRALILEEKLREYVLNQSDEVYEQEEVKARHILVKTKEEATAILEKLAAGESWETLAAENSLDTGNKDNSGDLGWFSKGMMVLPFEEAAFALEPGEISDPVKTDFGYHIIALDGKELRPMEGTALEEAQTAVYEAWFEDISAGYKIVKTDAADSIVITEPVFEPVEPTPTEVPSEENSADSSAEDAVSETNDAERDATTEKPADGGASSDATAEPTKTP